MSWEARVKERERSAKWSGKCRSVEARVVYCSGGRSRPMNDEICLNATIFIKTKKAWKDKKCAYTT